MSGEKKAARFYGGRSTMAAASARGSAMEESNRTSLPKSAFDEFRTRLPAAKITEIKQFTPSAWVPGPRAKEKSIAQTA